MSSSNPSGKSQRDRLVEEEQMLYLVEVSDSIRFLESRLEEVAEKTDTINAVAGPVEGLLIQKLLTRVDTLEENVGRTYSHECGDNSTGSVAHIEERVQELDSSQKTLLEMINGMLEDFQATLDVVRNDIVDVNARLNFTMRAMANQASAGGAISYFRAMNMVTKEAKVTLATMHLSEDAKLRWRSRRHPSSSYEEIRTTAQVLLKLLEGTNALMEIINQKSTKSTKVDSGATHNFTTEAEAKRLNLHWEKDAGRMKDMNFAALPIIGLVKRTMIRLGGWSSLVDFVVVKMDDLDVVLGMKFLLEHPVIPMPLAKCLVITGFAPSVVQTDLRQPDGLKMISAMQLKKGLTRDEPTFMAIPFDSSKNLREIVPKDILCVLEKYRDVMPDSLPKSLPPRRMIDHEIELVLGAKPPTKNAYHMVPPELAELQKQLDELLNAGFIRPGKASYGALVLFQKKKDEILRLCIDYRALNKLTDTVKSELPRETSLRQHVSPDIERLSSS
ncbi:uncharacterized protein E5676_scaffold594G00420 [Cucumis melo var. makuwa]|uniref:Reverse transcriptase n=1 Tax=Cucumis melo var. makuwa TaxID=1194695 RepID=A0A5D3C7K0_CUCMM|nr:uncharacterized protein E6C27_scaffold67G00380 [Cucumis melo var. makuwa]TYK06329.1 uncharacterized protein E5676_scaffold594G00420 [Cucumis melo var. makuwa]